MGNVGLLFVGAVLFINGMLLLGKVDAKAAAVFNLFVGALQVLTPTYLIFVAAGEPRGSWRHPASICSASPTCM